MTDPTDDSRARLRWSVYTLLIAISVGMMLGRILSVDAIDRRAVGEYCIKKALATKKAALRQAGLDENALQETLAREEARLRERPSRRRPFLSANDRSRWCIVRALVEPEMRVEGAPYAIDKVIAEPGWDTIDKVKHDGRLYSSKPPLFPTLMAGEYWIIHRLTGATLATHPYEIDRFMLITINVIPLVIAFVLLARLVERYGRSDWARVFVMGAATLGTFLTTFSVVINNHVPAAACSVVALYAAMRIWLDDDEQKGDEQKGERRWRYFVIAGLFAALTATMELPALALFGAIGLILIWKAPRRTMLGFVPAAAVVVAGFFATNWIAHQSLRPPYMHRCDGDNWYDYTYERDGRVISSYWNHPSGLDRGEPSTARYALHSLVGHHGVFSLTPVWLLSVAGVGIWLCRPDDRRLRGVAALIGTVSLACLVFYISVESLGRNYGGMTSGFRWMFWCAPMWLLAMLPAADAMASRRWTRLVSLVLLTLSVLSAGYPTWNPWTHPWLFDLLEHLDCL